jgi:hypothetical protein
MGACGLENGWQVSAGWPALTRVLRLDTKVMDTGWRMSYSRAGRVFDDREPVSLARASPPIPAIVVVASQHFPKTQGEPHDVESCGRALERRC